MLGKLFKHEWKSTWKVGSMMLLGLVLVSFFGWLSFQAPAWRAMARNSYYSDVTIWDLMSVGLLLMYVFMLIGLTYGIVIYLGVHFYKTMYTDEGYLTHTLPVTKHQILVSKILNSGLWMLLVTVGVLLSVMVLMLSMVGAMMPDGYGWKDLWDAMRPEMGYLNEIFRNIFGMKMSGYFLLVLLAFLISPFCSITVLFGAISIGQLFTKHRVLMAIVSYVGIQIVANLIPSMIRSLFTVQVQGYFTEDWMAGRYVNASLLSSTLFSVAEALILYFVSHYVISKKLNME